MGNNKSLGFCVMYPKSDRLSRYLTLRQIRLVQETWSLIKDDLKKTGLVIFSRFFEVEPAMKRQFPKIVTMNDLNQLDWEVDKERLQTHALTVMEGLGAAVESLDDTEFLNNVLFAIGQSHGKRRIKPQMLQKLWPALDYGLGQMLGVKYNKETAEAWRCIYMYIKERMSEGIKVSRAESQLKKEEQVEVTLSQFAPSAPEESTIIDSETEAVS